VRKILEANQHNGIELIEKAQNGNKDAFGQLFDRYFNKIFKYLLVRCGSSELAEDLAENVFLKAWMHLPSFKAVDGKVQFQAWLFRIAHNMLVDFYRTKKDALSLEDHPNEVRDDKHPEYEIIKREDQVNMIEAVRSLDELSQQVIICRFHSGLSHRETSQVLGIGEGNVRVIQFRALKKLKELIRDDDDK